MMILKDKILFQPPEIGCVLSLTGLPGGGSKIYDRSAYGNIGTITGATWVKLPGGLWCLSFDGQDDYVDCGNPSAMDFTTEDFTVELWFYANTLAGYQSFISRGQQNVKGWEIQFRDSGNLWFKTYTAGAYQSTRAGINTFAAGVWYHLAVVRQGADAKIYKSGSDVNAPTGSHPVSLVSASDVNLMMGRYAVQVMYLMNGLLSRIRIYNRALTALEIQNHFNQEKHLFGVW